MSEKLKPCPFCGSDNVEQWETVPTCYCNKCGATAYDRKAWNTRYHEDELEIRIKELKELLEEALESLEGSEFYASLAEKIHTTLRKD